MHRPPRAEALRRWSLFAALVIVVGALAWGLVIDDDDEADRRVATSDTAAAPTEALVIPTTAALATAPPTTGPTGVFRPDASAPGPIVGEGLLRTYRVEVEDGAGITVEEFTAEVERILSDPRGWTSADGISLQRLPGPDAEMTITLAAPATVDLLCHPLRTDGDVSCAKEGRAIINVRRWTEGAAPSGLDLARYREYLVSHELGHVLGHHHVECPGPGQPAPIMVQQTLGIGDCLPNPWPVPEVG